MWNFIVKGGVVMAPIILGSIFGLAIVLEKIWFFRRIKIDAAKFAEEVFADVKARKIPRAIWLCDKHSEFPLAAVFKAGLEKAAIPPDRLEKVLEQAGANQVQRLEKRLGALASITGISPLLGFLGTITGLIKAFMTWEQAGANITVSALALGIYEAMITTAAGLMVAIPCYLFYNYFISRIKYLSGELNEYAFQLVEVIRENREDGTA
jgi:biopolymer transport protein ExbB